jgi:hypothetical protein
MVTRVERTSKYRNKTFNGWNDKYWSFIIDNLGKPLDWAWLSRNPNLTMEMINANSDKPWNWNGISCNPNITMNDVKANPDRPWDWSAISSNPNITMEFIKDNPDKAWWISCNKFTHSKQDFIHNKYKEYLAAYRIQQWWFKIVSNPYHKVGKCMIERQYDSLGLYMPSTLE